ncbi:hypothetical protein QTO34_014171 [Cnephaeus nilssonii]|uniref:Uncharacterized protein n=1 Tax=Cnephaeus nilssonii TaxID=3371016 RepID=A0AA40HAX6_CNENI|nr:hypothetical protein QTO34_014171 [Eptesicus nilssonii]
MNLNGVWKNFCPQFVNDFHGFEDSVEVVIKNVVELSNQLDLEVEAEDVTELLASHGEELTAEDLTQLKQQFIEEEDTPTPEPRRFTSKELAGAFAMIEDALARFAAHDPNIDRYTKDPNIYSSFETQYQCPPVPYEYMSALTPQLWMVDKWW